MSQEIKLEDYDDKFDEFFEQVKKNPQYNSKLIKKAYDLAYEAHKNQRRRSGEPYIMHPVAVAKILFDFGMDNECIIGALLHDVVEDTTYSLDYIKDNFGEEVATLVDGVTKLGKIPLSTKEEVQAENIRKMFIAMNQDVRVIIIKLADRLHNMRTLQHMPPYKQREKSLETLEIYAPIAHRLGIRSVKDELEDLAIRYLDPIAYKEIENSLSMKTSEGTVFLEDIKKQIEEKLKPVMDNVQITYRVKSVHGIFRKVYIKGKNFEEIYDIYAVRIIVDSMIDCYNALGIVHDMFTPLPGRFKDYISTPKPNMYQSLHTTVLSKKGIPFEIQIRTWEMHRTAEYGIAAHWKYKLGKGGKDDLDNTLGWIHKMLENGDSADNAEDMVSSIKGDLSVDEIYVFTPKGDVKSLPKGSTVIDFAYAIHSAVGNKMTGAKVDGRIVPLDKVLKTGQVVEVITTNQPGKGPSRDWLNIVKTGEARSKIRSWFKKEKRDENIAHGKSVLDHEFKRNYLRFEGDKFVSFVQRIAERQHFDSIDDFYAAIGYGGVNITRLMPGIKDEYNRNWKEKTVQTPANVIEKVNSTPKSSGGVVVDGIDNCLINMARCCNPLPGEDIIGFITRGHGLTIHRRDCNNVPVDIEHSPEPERWVGAHWDSSIKVEARSSLDVYAIDRDGIVLDISTALVKAHVKMHAINARTINDGNCRTSITISVNNKEHLDSIIRTLSRIDGVYLIERNEHKGQL
ncbi:bifunctional (p)ppGpp synthetase/guanosine-3',5'-bis(diphosphate) 3'-pyrophosphohydrolase [uncultured Eubacterium sp.]|uniref:RelA/SpoT family protein n=1 Tax=uncultured Eubacterium sp. TaxID=165185 RepID=UPI002803D1C7|nr:bifunctional (p)ppGpp synthetase/guanosine-3',5'-bis(diphosphate) 3'-pyrophosphohydrolase [uncultured Eubacterium sp.]